LQPEAPDKNQPIRHPYGNEPWCFDVKNAMKVSLRKNEEEKCFMLSCKTFWRSTVSLDVDMQANFTQPKNQKVDSPFRSTRR
jgi:hypothetical protein